MIAISPRRDWAQGDFYVKSPDEMRPDVPVIHLALTYVLLVPLVLFAVHGGFSFEHSSWNNDLYAFGGKMAVVTTDAEAMRDRLQTVVGLTFCVGAMATRVRSLVEFAQRMPLMLFLPIYAMASALWSQDPGTSLRSGLSLLVTTLFAFYLTERFSRRQQMELLTAVGACIAAGSVIIAVVWPQLGLDHQQHEGALQGLFIQKNGCAEATLFLLTPALALSAIGRYGQMLRALYIVLCLGIILLTQSRTGWAITLIYFAFFGSLRMLRAFGRKDLLPLSALLFGAMGVITVAIVSYPVLVLALIGRSEGLSGRLQIWGAILASVLRRPLGGYGFDAFWSMLTGEATRIFSATGWVVTSAHNGFLNVALELGLVGLALVVLTFVQAGRHAMAAFRPGHSGYVDWCIGIVFLTTVYNVDERTLMAPQCLPWILYIVACVGLRRAAYGDEGTVTELRTAEETP